MVAPRALLLLLLVLGLARCGLSAESAAIELRALGPEGDFEYDEATGWATSPAGVQVTQGDATLTARSVRFERDSGEVEAEGDVRLQRGTEIWSGERLQYNFLTRNLRTENFRAGMKPLFLEGSALAGGLTNQVQTATNAMVTLDDYSDPFYRVRAREVTFVPGQYVEGRRATLYLGKVPVFYVPKYRRYFNRLNNHFSFRPGYRSLFGPYLLSRYNWYGGTNVEGAVRFDLREKRGVGGGLDLATDLGPAGTNEFLGYFTYDNEPGTNSIGGTIDSERWRVRVDHGANLQTNLTFKLSARVQSDEYVVRDFFEREYRENVQPQSYLEFDRPWSNLSLNLLTQGQFYDFYETVERLPDIKLTATRMQIGASPFYYEGENSASYLRHRFAYDQQPSYEAFRGDTYHQVLLPHTFFGWLNVTPRAGGRFTYYSKEEGDAATLESQRRGVFNTGAEVSSKLSRVWSDAHSGLLEVKGLRHILEPSVNYVFVPSPSVEPDRLPQFDTELSSFELLPLDFPDYNSIDSIDSQNVLRFGLRNRFQTKRATGIEHLVNWAMFLDWRLDPRPDQRTFNDFYSDLDFSPRSWMTLSSEIRYDINETTLRMANHTLTLEPSDLWSWKFGHRYLLEWPGMGPESGNNLFLSSFRLKLNENWSLRAVHHFEARDGTLEEQAYSVQRDFRSWTGALIARWREDRSTGQDFTIGVMVSLKAYPRYSLGSDRDYHQGLLE